MILKLLKYWKISGKTNYNFQYKLSMKLSGGGYRETGLMNITVPADSKKEAKKKLDKFIRKKVKLTVVSCES